MRVALFYYGQNTINVTMRSESCAVVLLLVCASSAQHAASATARFSALHSSHRREAATGPTCYGAFVPSFSWCSGYEKVDYNCSADGRYCAADTCIEDCYSCTIDYPGGVVHAASGRCCASIDPISGACVSPFPAVAPWNENYLWPNHHPALLVEDPTAYPHGPRVWSNGSAYNESGAFVFTMNSPGAKNDAGCPVLPSNTTFNVRLVHPISLHAHGAELDNCVLTCNHTAVSAGLPDPCLPGSVIYPASPLTCAATGSAQSGSTTRTWVCAAITALDSSRARQTIATSTTGNPATARATATRATFRLLLCLLPRRRRPNRNKIANWEKKSKMFPFLFIPVEQK